jgi:endonuclease YncB( thermonuclease family)
MPKNKKRSAYSYKRQIRLWGTVIILLFCLGQFIYQRACSKPVAEPKTVDADTLENVEIVSVYDGDTFKINLSCSLAAYCDKVSVRVRGVDTPEIKGKTAREKELAKKAKAFTKDFLAKKPVTLRNCGRDKYFRLLCDVSNGSGQDLARELIKRDLGYAYEGGKKSDRYK